MAHSEIGHAKNVARFGDILLHCEAFGQAYNPGNASIGLPALQAAYTNADAAVQSLSAAKTVYDVATNARETLFGGLSALGTRVVNALSASGASPLTVADARMHLRKIRGERGTRVQSVPTAPQPAPEGETPGAGVGADADRPRTVSASQRSYDQLVSHFGKLLLVVGEEPLYGPNEAELTVAGLQAHLAALNAANQNVRQRAVNYETALIHRNKVLYHPETGLYALAADVKSYVRSLYGSSAEEYKRIAAIRMKNMA